MEGERNSPRDRKSVGIGSDRAAWKHTTQKEKKKNQNLGETTKEGFLRGLCGYCACLVAMRGSTLLRDVRAEEKRPLFVAESAAAPRWSGVF